MKVEPDAIPISKESPTKDKKISETLSNKESISIATEEVNQDHMEEEVHSNRFQVM